MGILPPFGRTLRKSIIGGKFVPFEIGFGYAYNVYLTFCNLFSDGTVFRMIA